MGTLVGLRIMPLVWVIMAGVIAGALWFIADAIGDAREAKVMARINKAVERRNVDIAKHNEIDDQVAAVADAARAKALAEAQVLFAGCPATQEQAQALSRIK